MTSTAGAVTYDPRASYEVETQDVVYLNDGARDWLATVYRPRGAGPFPVLLDVHGGAWARNDRFQNAVNDRVLASTGLVVVAIDFHLSGAAPHPAAILDINYATRWLKLHARDFGGDATGLGGIGSSSGGHQLMLSAMRPTDPRYAAIPLPEAPELDASVAYVIMTWPVIDPLARHKRALAGEITPLTGTAETIAQEHIAYFGDEAAMVEANPQLMLERGERMELPPALIVQGAADEQLAPMMAERFLNAYSAAGGVIELAMYPGEPHGFIRSNPDGPNTRRALNLIKSFIARQLNSSP
jgi:acetyl esterase/lipase